MVRIDRAKISTFDHWCSLGTGSADYEDGLFLGCHCRFKNSFNEVVKCAQDNFRVLAKFAEDLS
jgi:hypothetical protein